MQNKLLYTESQFIVAQSQKSTMKGDYLEDLGEKPPAAKGHWRSGSKLAIRPIAGSKEVCGRSVAILRALFHFVYNSYLEFRTRGLCERSSLVEYDERSTSCIPWDLM